MPLTPDLTALATQDFALPTTFRRSGEPVPTPVWITRLEEALVVSTPDGTGKLKRLRHTPRVTLQACSRRGTPVEGAPVVEAVAEVSRDPRVIARTEASLKAKYGWQWRLVLLIERVARRGRSQPRPVVEITAPDPAANH